MIGRRYVRDFYWSVSAWSEREPHGRSNRTAWMPRGQEFVTREQAFDLCRKSLLGRFFGSRPGARGHLFGTYLLAPVVLIVEVRRSGAGTGWRNVRMP